LSCESAAEDEIVSVYEEFRDAWVDHFVFATGTARLAAARARMNSDPQYDERRYLAALLSAERVAATFGSHVMPAE
jgi:hypothetical protein